MFFMRTPEDLSGMDGELILTEFCEQYPPHMMQVGMASKICNYYKRVSSEHDSPAGRPLGTPKGSHSWPLLQSLNGGSESGMFQNETKGFSAGFYTTFRPIAITFKFTLPHKVFMENFKS